MARKTTTTAQPKNAAERKAVVPVTATEMANNANSRGHLAVDDSLVKAMTGCQVGRDEFLGKAEPLSLTVCGSPNLAEVKEFSSGGFGWYANGKVGVRLASPVKKSEWEQNAPAIEVELNGIKQTAWPKAFSTGSVGWNISDKVILKTCGDKLARSQVSFNLTVTKSKEDGDDRQYSGLVVGQLGCSLSIIGSKEVRN